jgi:type IV pilus assembly protein PilE
VGVSTHSIGGKHPKECRYNYSASKYNKRVLKVFLDIQKKIMYNPREIMRKIFPEFKVKRRSFKALSLTEVLIVMVIIGILLMVALPNQTALISQAKAQEAKMQLSHLHTLEKQYFYMNSRYSNNLTELGFEQENLVTSGGNANYKVEIVEASPTTFKARATAVVDFDQDGQINVWEIDHSKALKEITKD